MNCRSTSPADSSPKAPTGRQRRRTGRRYLQTARRQAGFRQVDAEAELIYRIGNSDNGVITTVVSCTTTMDMYRYENKLFSYPGHPRSPNGSEPVATVDGSGNTGKVIPWATSMAMSPGACGRIRSRSLRRTSGDDETVLVIGQVTADESETSDQVEVYVEKPRKPGAGICEVESQVEFGCRFGPV